MKSAMPLKNADHIEWMSVVYKKAVSSQSEITYSYKNSYAIGRRTFLKHCLGNAFPGVIKSYLDITVAQYQGPDDLYRSLCAAYRVSSLVDAARDFSNFSNFSLDEKVEKLFNLILEISEEGELLTLIDEGGIYDVLSLSLFSATCFRGNCA